MARCCGPTRLEKRQGPSDGTSPGSTTSTATGAPISPSGHRSQRTPAVRRSAAPGSSRRQAARSCITGREQIGGAASAGSWRRSVFSTATAKARSSWRRQEPRIRSERSPESYTSIPAPPGRSCGTGPGPSRASCTDGWSLPPAIGTETASRTSPSVRPGIVAERTLLVEGKCRECRPRRRALAVVAADRIVEARGASVVQVRGRIGDAPEARGEILVQRDPALNVLGRVGLPHVVALEIAEQPYRIAVERGLVGKRRPPHLP